ncbi:MAG TPA: 3-hydroxybutyryl-CoA dehydrogenase [Thermoanaerobaculia bacterium]|jgi:3-hydroxybutyryl-CoA dehydrogenase|nr:3-hydroxybutyryl-CoA dehydrogenase [Thermoanaerobaculia bacterium]
MRIRRVGVLGAGLMGSGIAEVCAKSGYETVVREISEELARKGIGRIESSLAKAVERGKLAAGDRDAARGRLKATTRLEDFEACDIVIEAVVENLDVKKEIFRELDRICGESAIFCSNTSSLTITELSAATRRPDRFAGLHFFIPAPVMKLVEVVRTIATSDETIETLLGFAKSLRKEPILAKDNSGFIVNRLLVPYLLDAVRALEEGVGSREDIDKGMELGCGHPMGPLKLLDFVGLDTTYAIAEIMFAEYREKRFAPPPLLKRMVLAGRYGRKSGRGFYEYPS